MADKKFSAVISIGAELGASFRTTFGGLDSKIKAVGSSLRGLNDSQKGIAGYAKALQSVQAARDAMAEQGRQLMGLRGQVASTKDIEALAALDKQIQAQEKSYAKARAALTKQTAALDKQREALKAAGIDTSNLSGEMERLGKEAAQASARLSSLGKIKGLTAELTASVKRLAVEAAAAGVALTAVGFSTWKVVTGFANFADEAAETGAALGMTSKELLGLRYAGERVGVEAAKMDAGLNKFNQTLQAARTEGGKAADMFDELGLDAEMLAEMPAAQRMEMLAEAFKNYNGEIPKSAFATEFFGSKAYKMANVLGLGADELRRLRKEAEDTGYIPSAEMQKRAEQYDEAFGKFKATLTGIRNEIGSALLPMVSRFMEFLSEHTLILKVAIAGFAAVITGTAVVAVAKLGLTAITTVKQVSALVAEMRKLGAIQAIGNASGIPGLGKAAQAVMPRLAMLASTILPNLGMAVSNVALAFAGLVASVGLGPILLIGAALAAVAITIIKFWQPIKAFFSGLWEGFREGFGEVSASLKPLTDLLTKTLGPVLKWIGGLFTSLFTPIQYTKDELSGVASIGRTVGQVIGVIAGAINILINPIARLAKLVELVRTGLAAIGIGKAPSSGTGAEAGATGSPVQAALPSVPVAGSTRTSRTTTNNNSITVNAAPGQDERKLADEIMRKLREREQQDQRSALYDAVPAY